MVPLSRRRAEFYKQAPRHLRILLRLSRTPAQFVKVIGQRIFFGADSAQTSMKQIIECSLIKLSPEISRKYVSRNPAEKCGYSLAGFIAEFLICQPKVKKKFG